YDAFGRRVSKVREGQVASLQSVSKVQYQWDGDQLVGQVQYYADGTTAREVQWVYEPGSFRPLAQVERKGADTRLHYVVTDLAGTARELCSETGEVHWRGEQGLWNGHREDRLPVGRKRYLGDAANEEVYCELRYQGQIYDAETGLYYNRHRYYDADSGQYISPDPIGLAGGLRPQGYVHNPLEWVDPLGLEKLPKKANPSKVVNDLNDFEGKDYHFGNETFKLDKRGMKHVLERHHPEYWDGSIKKTQSFLDKNMSIGDVKDAINSVLKQNRNKLIEKGAGTYQMKGSHNGVDYVLGLNKGRIGQFYPE
ncbi:RHS repeat-associated core domain-containing protein, partial [Lonsdalea quercina]|uniref:RHS repeat-associated core domain-containing protein n=1 Tax=Lonsdalea quercina TaxID=71657 RepID=UPI0039759ACC